jgi:Tol biopolymer transport system component
MRPSAGRLLSVLTLVGVATTGLAAGGSAASGSTPGPNGDIVFAADVGSGFELYTIGPNGANLRQITHVDGEALQPDWSPDGRRIAFELDAEDHAGIAIVDADGSHLRELTHVGFKGQPAFTPDGRHLVYECDCDPQGIFIMRIDGTHRRRLSTNPFPEEGDSDPNVSPDGTTVTFVRHKVDGELQALFAVDIDGSHERLIVPYRLEVAIKHDWAPDGSRIVITTDADYPGGRSPNVATVRPDGSHLRMLTSYSGGTQGAFAGSYSPNGRWIVFRVENLEREQFRLFKFHPDGSHRELIARLPFAPRGSDWGPDPEE